MKPVAAIEMKILRNLMKFWFSRMSYVSTHRAGFIMIAFLLQTLKQATNYPKFISTSEIIQSMLTYNFF